MQLSLLPSLDDVAVVQCAGNITQNDIPPGTSPLEELLGPSCYGCKVLLNLERTHYVDSSGISWLMSTHRHFLQAGGNFVLYAIPPMVNQVLRLLRMSLILPMATDEAAARALVLGGKR